MWDAVKAMDESVEARTKANGNTFKDCPARLVKDSFHISIAGVGYCLHESSACLTPDARASIFKCALKHCRGNLNNAKYTALPAHIILAMVESGYNCAGTDDVFERCVAVQKSVLIKKNIFSKMQLLFAYSVFGSEKCRRINVVFEQDQDCL